MLVITEKTIQSHKYAMTVQQQSPAWLLLVAIYMLHSDKCVTIYWWYMVSSESLWIHIDVFPLCHHSHRSKRYHRSTILTYIVTPQSVSMLNLSTIKKCIRKKIKFLPIVKAAMKKATIESFILNEKLKNEYKTAWEEIS